MSALKRLIAIKDKVKKSNIGYDNTPNVDDKNTYYQLGYNGAIKASGDSAIFKSCLDDIYEKFKAKCREDEKEQKRLSAPFVEERERQKTSLRKHEALISIKEGKKEEIKSQVNILNKDISSVKNSPDKYGLDATKKPKAQFFIGLLILLPITLYLLVFYISASYSAFFKVFESTSVFESIFDANAFTKAINDGWLEAVFVCTIPFAFMGLGYLIHMFQKNKKSGLIKVAALFVITFIFDAILAYQIESKIYELTKTLSDPIFNLQIAFTKVEFWGIIFAGFVVYLIWGLVFDFVMKEYDNIDKIKAYINKLKEDKLNLKRQLSELNDLISNSIKEMAEINGKINELQTKIDGFIFPNRKYLLYHAEFVNGWFMGISGEIALPKDKKEKLIKDCEKISDTHLANRGLDENNEHVIYKNRITN